MRVLNSSKTAAGGGYFARVAALCVFSVFFAPSSHAIDGKDMEAIKGGINRFYALRKSSQSLPTPVQKRHLSAFVLLRQNRRSLAHDAEFLRFMLSFPSFSRTGSEQERNANLAFLSEVLDETGIVYLRPGTDSQGSPPQPEAAIAAQEMIAEAEIGLLALNQASQGDRSKLPRDILPSHLEDTDFYAFLAMGRNRELFSGSAVFQAFLSSFAAEGDENFNPRCLAYILRSTGVRASEALKKQVLRAYRRPEKPDFERSFVLEALGAAYRDEPGNGHIAGALISALYNPELVHSAAQGLKDMLPDPAQSLVSIALSSAVRSMKNKESYRAAVDTSLAMLKKWAEQYSVDPKHDELLLALIDELRKKATVDDLMRPAIAKTLKEIKPRSEKVVQALIDSISVSKSEWAIQVLQISEIARYDRASPNRAVLRTLVGALGDPGLSQSAEAALRAAYSSYLPRESLESVLLEPILAAEAGSEAHREGILNFLEMYKQRAVAPFREACAAALTK